MDWSQPISIGLILLMIAVLPCIYGTLSVDVLSGEQMVCVGRGSQQMGRKCCNWLCFSRVDRIYLLKL